MYVVSLLQSQALQQGSMLSLVMTMAPLLLIFYFFIIRPQNKKQKETQKMIDALKKGDKIITIGGIHGVISSTKEKTVIVKVDDNTKIEFSRSAVASVMADKVEKTDTAAEKNRKKNRFFRESKKMRAIRPKNNNAELKIR